MPTCTQKGSQVTKFKSKAKSIINVSHLRRSSSSTAEDDGSPASSGRRRSSSSKDPSADDCSPASAPSSPGTWCLRAVYSQARPLYAAELSSQEPCSEDGGTPGDEPVARTKLMAAARTVMKAGHKTGLAQHILGVWKDTGWKAVEEEPPAQPSAVSEEEPQLAAEPEDIRVGDLVVVTSDEDKMRRCFRQTGHRWRDAMRKIFDSKQMVLEVRDDVIGLKEADADSGEPVWYYPRSCVAKQEEEDSHVDTLLEQFRDIRSSMNQLNDSNVPVDIKQTLLGFEEHMARLARLRESSRSTLASCDQLVGSMGMQAGEMQKWLGQLCADISRIQKCVQGRLDDSPMKKTGETWLPIVEHCLSALGDLGVAAASVENKAAVDNERPSDADGDNAAIDLLDLLPNHDHEDGGDVLPEPINGGAGEFMEASDSNSVSVAPVESQAADSMSLRTFLEKNSAYSDALPTIALPAEAFHLSGRQEPSKSSSQDATDDKVDSSATGSHRNSESTNSPDRRGTWPLDAGSSSSSTTAEQGTADEAAMSQQPRICAGLCENASNAVPKKLEPLPQMPSGASKYASAPVGGTHRNRRRSAPTDYSEYSMEGMSSAQHRLLAKILNDDDCSSTQLLEEMRCEMPSETPKVAREMVDIVQFPVVPAAEFRPKSPLEQRRPSHLSPEMQQRRGSVTLPTLLGKSGTPSRGVSLGLPTLMGRRRSVC